MAVSRWRPLEISRVAAVAIVDGCPTRVALDRRVLVAPRVVGGDVHWCFQSWRGAVPTDQTAAALEMLRARCPELLSLRAVAEVFPRAAGGAEGMAKHFGVPFLGRVPLDPKITHACERGTSYTAKVQASGGKQTPSELLVELERCRHLQHRVAVPRLHHHRREPGARLGGAVQAEAAPVARLRRCQAGERWWGGGTAAYE